MAWGEALNVFVNVKFDPKDSRFWHMRQLWSNDGVTWPADQFTDLDGQASPYGPSAAPLDNETNDLVVAWEMPNKKQLAVGRFVGGVGWSDVFLQPHLGVPQLAPLRQPGNTGAHPLAMVSRGTANVGANNLHFFVSNDGWEFTAVGDSGSVTDRKPAIVTADSIGIVFDFIGLNRSPGGHRLNIETFRF